MSTKKIKPNSSRREFFKKSIIAAGLLGIGCYRVSAESKKEIKALTDSGMSFQEVFEFAFGSGVTLLKNFERQIGKEKLYELIQNANKEKVLQEVEMIKNGATDNSISSLATMMEEVISVPPYSETHSIEITEKTDKVLEVKYTKCIYSEIFKKMDAPELGYVCACSSSDEFAHEFNPKMSFKNPKNMMKGDSYCIERYELNS